MVPIHGKVVKSVAMGEFVFNVFAASSDSQKTSDSMLGKTNMAKHLVKLSLTSGRRIFSRLHDF